VIYGGAVTGNLNAHSISLLIRGIAGGETVDIGLRDASSGAVQLAQTVVCTTAYQYIQIHGVIPADIDQQFCLDVDAGDAIGFIAAQLEEGPRCTYPIPNVATAAAATRSQDVLDLAVSPEDTSGRVECTLTPIDWSGVQMGADATVISRVTTADDILHADSADTGGWASSDGTTQVTETTTPPADGVSRVVKVEWKTGRESIEVAGAVASAAYDGARAGSGAYRLASAASVIVKDLKVYEDVP